MKINRKEACNGLREMKNSPVAARNLRPSQRGIALVITLIMLSVTLVMAIAYLALSRRERASVSTVTDTTTARLAADSALAAAQAQIMVNLLNTNSLFTPSNGLYNFGLIVSTNYINSYGFVSSAANPTNVNYSYYSTRPGPLSLADFIQNIANLQYLPRVPVFISTNSATASDFRYYLDLNRNGRFDDTGLINETNDLGNATGNVVSEIGDPQWIGMLARPDAVHSANNQFVSRYAFFAIPIGNGLDINAIHNEVFDTSLGVREGFFRNQSVGSWEINLAAFLADLNTNEWLPTLPQNDTYYSYYQPGTYNRGRSFDDALAIVSWRYGQAYSSLASLSSVFTNSGNLQYQPFDIFPFGPLLVTNTTYLFANANNNWAGADNTNKFYDLTVDLFDTNKVGTAFPQHLQQIDTNISTYDQYTFYRMLSQLGTDSDPDDGKMNLNYKNITNGTVIVGMETNLIAWSALDFFTNAADRMLRYYTTNWFQSGPSNYLATFYNVTNEYYYLNANNGVVTNDPTGFGLTNFTMGLAAAASKPYLNLTNQIPAFSLTNIPVYVNGQFVYSSAVNRILQLAANLYDASTNSMYPSVFRPMFNRDLNGNVFIIGYQQIDGVSAPPYGTASYPVDLPLDVTNTALTLNPINPNNYYPNGNVYGVPWIIGAKKGFPAFNKLGMQTMATVTRKLQISRSTIPTVLTGAGATTFRTNQLLAFSVSNAITAECWNSYTNPYNSPINIYALDSLALEITNDAGQLNSYFAPPYQISTNITVSVWPGYNGLNPAVAATSFTNPISSVIALLPNSDFYFSGYSPSYSGFQPDIFNRGWQTNKYDFPFPNFGIVATNRFQLYMTAASNGVYHIIDYVSFAGPQTSLALSAAIENNNPAAVGYGTNMWSQSKNTKGIPYGILSQIYESENNITSNDGGQYWSGADTTANQQSIDGFTAFMGVASPYTNNFSALTNSANYQYYATNYIVQTPYTPTVIVSQYTSWQANDPLVHYLASDLNFLGTEANGVAAGVSLNYNSVGYKYTAPSFVVANDRYQPWGIKAPTALVAAEYNFSNPYNTTYKDSLIYSSDYWSFPTNLYPTVGWIGQVHRGTPWQTVYLKATNVLHSIAAGGDLDSGTNTWTTWTGNYNIFDAANTAPTEDRMLFDVFTTRLNDNAARGTLSVNQNHLAAWSAVFSGMTALTNIVPNITYNLANFSKQPTNGFWLIQPAGLQGLNSTLGDLVTNINNQRAVFINADGVVGSFEHVGDILSAPQLTQASPFLNTTNVQQEFGISDEAYEWLPQQMMGLLRMTTAPRYVVYAYGQALRPALNGVVTTASNFGLVTNYQVVAESAVRAIVSVQSQVTNTPTGPMTNYTTKVESYNVLPPN